MAPTTAAGAVPSSAVPGVASCSLLLLALVVAWERAGLFLTCKNDGSKGHLRKEGLLALEGTSGALKTPEGGDGGEGVEMRVGDSRNPVFQWMGRCERNACT